MIANKNTSYNFLTNTSETGKLIQKKDWSNTSLGHPDTWPQSLKTMVSVILNNPFGMNIMWGKDLIQLYNESYSMMIGPSKHPKAIGQKACETFAEIWDTIGPMLESALKGKPTLSSGLLLQLNRNGFLEDCYFDFSYSPIKDESGEIGGVLVTAIETTKTKKIELDLKDSQSQLQFAIDSAELATFDYDPKTNIFYGNQRLNDWFGIPDFSPHKPIDLNLALLSIIEEDRERVATAISNSFDYASGGDYDIEYTVVHQQTKKTRVVNAKGKTWFDQNKEPYRFNGTLEDITKRKKIETEIKNSEKNLRSIIHQAPIAMAIFRGSQYVVEIVNTNALNLWRRQKEEVLNKPILEAMPELVSQGFKELLDDVYATGNRFSADEQLVQISRNGVLETVYVNFSYEPLLNASGEIDGVMAIGFEVTQQVLNRKKIEANEEKLNFIIDASELGTWEYDIQNEKVYCSEKCLELLSCKNKHNYSHSELISTMHPEDLVIRNAELEKALSKGDLAYSVRIIEEGKFVRWIATKGKVFYDDNRQPVKILGTIRDATEEKSIQQKLEERERKFSLLANSMPQLVWTANPDGTLNYFNDSVFEYSGMSLEKILEVGWLDIVHPEDRDENIKKWTHSISSGSDFLFEHRFRKHTGEYRWKLSRAIPQRDENGHIQMWVGTSTDIQEQKLFASELEKQVYERTKEINQKNKDLEKINKELQSFVYISSHDLQEPLRKIQTFSTRIVDKEISNLSDHGKDYFKRIQNAANRMQMLIEDLLAYSRTGTKHHETEILTLSHIVAEVKTDLEEDLNEKNATINLEATHNINVIPFQFKQLLINLITNSLKFSLPDKDPVILIQSNIITGVDVKNINLLPNSKYSHITISDNGIGFDNEYKEKIFELFQRLHGKQQYAGTGIGLAIVKKIIDNHQGFITASGSPNQGASFDIYLPLS